MKDEVVMMMLEELEDYPMQTEEEWDNWCDAMDAYYEECQRRGIDP